MSFPLVNDPVAGVPAIRRVRNYRREWSLRSESRLIRRSFAGSPKNTPGDGRRFLRASSRLQQSRPSRAT